MWGERGPGGRRVRQGVIWPTDGLGLVGGRTHTARRCRDLSLDGCTPSPSPCRAVWPCASSELRAANQDQGRRQGLGLAGGLGRRRRLVRALLAAPCGIRCRGERSLSALPYPGPHTKLCPNTHRYERAAAEQQLEELEETERKATERLALTKAAGLDSAEPAQADGQ